MKKKMKKRAVKILAVSICMLVLLVTMAVPCFAFDYEKFFHSGGIGTGSSVENPYFEFDFNIYENSYNTDRALDLGALTLLQGDSFAIDLRWYPSVVPKGCDCCEDSVAPDSPYVDTVEHSFDVSEEGFYEPFKLFINQDSDVYANISYNPDNIVIGEYPSADEAVYHDYQLNVYKGSSDNANVLGDMRYRTLGYGVDGAKHCYTYIVHSFNIFDFKIKYWYDADSYIDVDSMTLLSDMGYCDMTSPYLEDLLSNVEQSYNRGYEDGFTDGWNNGYTQGRTSGYEEGMQLGWENGLAGGLEQGYEDGYTDGWDVGFLEGVENGIAGSKREFWHYYLIYEFGTGLDDGADYSWLDESSWDDLVDGAVSNQKMNAYRAYLRYKGDPSADDLFPQETEEGIRAMSWNELTDGMLRDIEDIGYSEGYGEGYGDGFGEGQTEAYNNSTAFKDGVFAIFEAPVTLVNGMLDFDLFGINLLSLAKTLITFAVVGVILALILKNKA